MSRFVSGGTNDEAIERDEAWLKAQQAIEAAHREKAELGKQEDGKSLYETLQANKAAKQEQFEEALRLRNQFRSLDEDEVAFLDNVLESTRAKEAEVRKETTEQLQAFRKQQEEAEKSSRQALAPTNPDTVETSWSTGARKRKKGRSEVLGGVKLRKTSSTDIPIPSNATEAESQKEGAPGVPDLVRPLAGIDERTVGPDDGKAVSVEEGAEKTQKSVDVQPTAPTLLGLGAYSSDEDDD